MNVKQCGWFKSVRAARDDGAQQTVARNRRSDSAANLDPNPRLLRLKFMRQFEPSFEWDESWETATALT
jgi:hypothetical protein